MASEICKRRSGVVHWVGLDVSKAGFDAGFVAAGQKFPATRMCDVPADSFERNRQGAELFLDWLDGIIASGVEPGRVRVVMEATGKYSVELAVWLLERRPSLEPAIVCPSHTAAFIKSLGLRNKTDKLDARALGFYGVEREPVAYEPPTPEQAELQALSRWRDALVGEKIALGNRAAEGTVSKFVRQLEAKRLRLLKADIERTEAEMKKVVNSSPKLKHDVELLCTIYGVAFVTATTIISELGDLRRFDRARKLTAFAGVSPRMYKSGTSVNGRTRMCKKGNPRVRSALYMSALTAIRGNSDLKRTYTRLLNDGKEPMAALGAIMRKLLCIMRIMLIKERPYEPDWKLHENSRSTRYNNRKIA